MTNSVECSLRYSASLLANLAAWTACPTPEPPCDLDSAVFPKDSDGIFTHFAQVLDYQRNLNSQFHAEIGTVQVWALCPKECKDAFLNKWRLGLRKTAE
jgi:hypothetical protein